jgi:hypothetical protein
MKSGARRQVYRQKFAQVEQEFRGPVKNDLERKQQDPILVSKKLEC